jgi:hypothetical protein
MYTRSTRSCATLGDSPEMEEVYRPARFYAIKRPSGCTKERVSMLHRKATTMFKQRGIEDYRPRVSGNPFEIGLISEYVTTAGVLTVPNSQSEPDQQIIC